LGSSRSGTQGIGLVQDPTEAVHPLEMWEVKEKNGVGLTE